MFFFYKKQRKLKFSLQTEVYFIQFSELSGNLTTNEFSWNKFANTLYIDSPLKTGFSQTEELENLSGNAVSFNTIKDI